MAIDRLGALKTSLQDTVKKVYLGQRQVHEQKLEILERYQTGINLSETIREKKAQLEQYQEDHIKSLKEQEIISQQCKRSVDAKIQELSINKNKQETEIAELIRQETLACLTSEDELSHLVRCREQ